MRNKMEMNHVLVVEDDKEIREGVEIYLKSQGYEVFQAADGVEGLEVIEKEDIHLAIVDIMMPRMDGISMVVKLREKYDFPVIFLSAKSEEVDKIMGLNMGADDYLVKPFFRDELLARVHSLLRRYLSLGSASDNSGNLLQYYELTLNTELKKLYVRGDEVRLTATEYKIMSLLLSRPGRIFPAEEIYERVWEQDSYSVENTVMIHINRLRKKIELNPKKPEYLKVVWGIGYKIEK
jgi:DNA-binding response OmpR family regulator